MSVELIKNIKSLTKIQLKQNKNMFIIAISALGVFMLVSNIGLLFYRSDAISTFIDTSNLILGVFLAMLLAIIPITTNILTNNKISMYPGTSVSRFLSRILADHIVIVAIFAFAFLMYCIEYPILMAISAGGADFLLTYAFDINYALVGTLNIMSYYLLLYGICILVYSLATKLGMIKTIILYTGIIIVVILLLKNDIISLSVAKDWILEERNLGIFILKTWSIWLITMLLSFLVANSTKVMKEEVHGIKFIIIPLGCIVIFFSAANTSSGNVTNSYYYNGTEISNFKELKKTDIYKETLVKCDGLNLAKMMNLGIHSGLHFLTEKQAIDGGIIANDSSLKNEILVVTFFPAQKCNNQYVYDYYLENMTISTKNSLLYYSFPNTKTIYNFLWGNSYKFLNSYDYDYESDLNRTYINIYNYEYDNNPDMNAKVVYIIAPDSVMIN